MRKQHPVPSPSTSVSVSGEEMAQKCQVFFIFLTRTREVTGPAVMSQESKFLETVSQKVKIKPRILLETDENKSLHFDELKYIPN